ncbi:DUF3318 domain-containing protein [Tumidithrix helvetica PCC 7403]
MNSSQEILRLQDLLPASWRMKTTIKSKSDQQPVMVSNPILPWASVVQVSINFRLWSQLSEANRDLLLLREVGWRQESKWLKTGVYQSLALLSVGGGVVELVQGDVTGIAIALLLGTVAVNQVWRKNQGSQIQIDADLEAIRAAQRRGYTEELAARALLEAIPAAAKLEGRYIPEFTELLRCQNLRAIAGLSSVTVPSNSE